MKLTKKKAIDLSVKLWTWLAETGKEKEGWPGWVRNGGKHPDSASDCFLCEYSRHGHASWSCETCPYYCIYDHCMNSDSPYSKWEDALSDAARKRYAQQFLKQLKKLQEDL